MNSRSRLDVLCDHVQNPAKPSKPTALDIEDLNRAFQPEIRAALKRERLLGCNSCSCGSELPGRCGTSSHPAQAPVSLLSPVAVKGAPVPHPYPAPPPPLTLERSQGIPKKPKIQSADEYIQSLRGRDLKVYLFGELVKNPVDHPVIWPSVNAVAETYRIAQEEPEIGSATTLSGVRASRFLHIAESSEDLVNQSRMQRKLGQRTGTCFQRCVGMDAANSIFSISYDIDKAHGTQYHQRFRRFIQEMQENNYVVGGAMTDPKGDRSKSPTQQHDPDLFVHVCERRVDGVVIRGAKMHQTGTINSHWMYIMPGGRLDAQDKDYAITCAVPVDAPGITYIYGRQSCDLRSMEGSEIDQGNAKYGGQELTVILEDVFVPHSHIFMDGEFEFCQELVERFTAYHRRSYICKAGLGDVLLGASATVAEYNGAHKASHVKDKLVQIAYLNENIAGTALAASYAGKATASGNFLPDVLLANVCKHNVTQFPYEISRLTQDLAGGLLVTLPSDKDFKHDVIGPLLDKYISTGKGVTPENRRRILRLIENITMGRNAVGYLTESMHGAGSPQAQRVIIQRLMDIDSKKAFAKALAGIKE